MGNSTSTIELNGKRYDARTGAMLSSSGSASAPMGRTSPQPKKQPSGQILDGFVRRAPNKMNPNGHPSAPQTQQKQAVSKTTVKNASRKLEKSRTLMRPAVKKPAVIKNDIQAQKSPPKVQPTRTSRFARAESTDKSPLVSRFGSPVSTITKKHASLPVVAPSFSVLSKNVSDELNKLEHALEDANAHLHQLEDNAISRVPFLRRFGFRNKTANLATLSCAFLLLIGFFAYQNYAAVSMKVAASRSGVRAQLPGYKPAGYAIEGGVKSEPGKVTVSFKSRTDDKHFTVTQQASNWNSASLLANDVTKNHCNTCFQTWQNDGKTVYIYDNSNATWVNGGVWYQVEGNADLTSDQLLRLANSL